MNITLIAGSNRKASTSTKLLQYMADRLASKGVAVTFVDLRKLPLPLYSPDSEEQHVNVISFLQSVKDADGIIFGTPEYHGSISGVLKNAIDYLDEELSGKSVLSVSSAGGPMGISSLMHLQNMIRNLHGINSPEWISIGMGQHDFGMNGEPAEAEIRQRVEDALEMFLDITKSLAQKHVELKL